MIRRHTIPTLDMPTMAIGSATSNQPHRASAMTSRYSVHPTASLRPTNTPPATATTTPATVDSRTRSCLRLTVTRTRGAAPGAPPCAAR